MWRNSKSLDVLLGEINRSAPGRDKSNDGSIGDEAHSQRQSDHNPCICHRAVCARDFTHDVAGDFDAHEFANWLANRVKLGQEYRVKYIISDGRICSGPKQSYRAGVWRDYKGSNPHKTHVHVSVSHPQSLFDDPTAWGWELAIQRSYLDHPAVM